jgi:hypothetical protein
MLEGQAVLWTKIIVIAIAGALGAAMVNRGIAVFHDGVRALMPELIEGRMGRGELASTAFGLSFGLIIWLGLPFSLASAMLLNHSLWLGTDIIGTWFPGSFEKNPLADRQSILGLSGAIVVGALYGGLLVVGLEGFVRLFAHLPVNIWDSMGQLGAPIVFTFAAIPAIAVAYQYGVKSGVAALLLTLLGRQVVSASGQANPDGWAFAVGMAVLIAYAIRERKGEQPGEGVAALFTERAKRIRSHLPAIAVLGAVYGLACHQAIMMEGPQSLVALAQGDRAAAINFTIARALSFTPLKAMSALATGVFALDGFGFVATAGLVSPNAVVAAVAGAVVMSLEALSLVVVARFLDRFPGLLEAASSVRTGMTKLLEVAALVGGMMAANSMAPGLGFLAVAGLYLLNESAGTPVVRVAVGPLAVILVGITANLLALLHQG